MRRLLAFVCALTAYASPASCSRRPRRRRRRSGVTGPERAHGGRTEAGHRHPHRERHHPRGRAPRRSRLVQRHGRSPTSSRRNRSRARPRPTTMEVRFAYDGGAFYVGARMWARNATEIQAPLGRRDNTDQAEHILIALDTFLDRRTSVVLGVTASGVRLDRYHATDSRGDLRRRLRPGVGRAHLDRQPTGGRPRSGFRSRSCASTRKTTSRGASTCSASGRASTRRTPGC